MECRVGDWVWSKHHGEAGQVVAVEELWGLRTLRLWLPSSDSTVRVTSETVSAVGERPSPNEHELSFIAAAARIADTLSTDALLAPVESKVIPFLPVPTVVHQIPHLMAHRRRPGDKVALIVVDGMSLSQWTEIKRASGSAWMDGMTVEESAVFAWIPTVTSVSRQAILSGQPPMFFESTIHTTSAEERLWKAFWEERGWRRDRIGYIKHKDGEHESSLCDRVWDAVDSGQTECLAVIVNSIDRLVHGVGPEGNVLAAAVRQWGQNGHIGALLRGLVSRGFEIAVCSDHGNVESAGVGRPDVGSIPEDQGQRAITFPDAGTLEAARKKVPGSQPWPGPGLPSSAHVLMPPGRGAFSTAGATVRTHGGTSIEEVFVPLVRVSRST